MNQGKISRIVSLALLLLVILFILSGFGITKPRIVGAITFGLLDRGSSFSLHSFLVLPFLILLIAHIIPIHRIKRMFRKIFKD